MLCQSVLRCTDLMWFVASCHDVSFAELRWLDIGDMYCLCHGGAAHMCVLAVFFCQFHMTQVLCDVVAGVKVLYVHSRW